MKKYILLMSLLTSVAFSQSAFLEKGESAVLLGVGLGYQSVDDITTLTVGPVISYSYQGFLDVTAAYAYHSIEETSANTFGGSATFHPLKFIENSPVGLATGIGYESTSFEGDMSASALTFDAGLYKNFRIHKYATLVPSYTFTYASVTQEIEFFGVSTEVSTNTTLHSFGADLGMEFTDAAQVLTGLGVILDEDFSNPTLGISVGYLHAF